MSRQILGIHHVTAICGEPQANLDFYAGVLGLRLIKLTVNFDDPGTYHFYYGDGAGHPGTILTFFPWPHAPRGRHGTGQVTATAFAVPRGALTFWRERLAPTGVETAQRFGEELLSVRDPDGLKIELIESAAVEAERASPRRGIPADCALHGFHSATLSEEGYQRTASLLTETLGFRLIGDEGNRFRYAVGDGGAGARVDVLCAPEELRGSVLAGTVHHIAWRAPDEAQQRDWLKHIAGLGYNISPVLDRKYFRSIYFREPGGILFEIATDGPGFTVDEPLDELGTHLLLPAQYEPARAQLETVLPKLRLPEANA